MASRVFPLPPVPVSVTSRASREERLDLADLAFATDEARQGIGQRLARAEVVYPGYSCNWAIGSSSQARPSSLLTRSVAKPLPEMKSEMKSD